MPPIPLQQKTKAKIWKNWKDRIRYAQRHPITLYEIRKLSEHPEVFQALQLPDPIPGDTN